MYQGGRCGGTFGAIGRELWAPMFNARRVRERLKLFRDEAVVRSKPRLSGRKKSRRASAAADCLSRSC